MSDKPDVRIECPCGRAKVSGKQKDVELLSKMKLSCGSCRRQLQLVDGALQFVRPKGETLN